MQLVQPVQDHPSHSQRVMNVCSGRTECLFVNLEAVYPDPINPTFEICFEELRAARRGWLNRDWSAEKYPPRAAQLKLNYSQDVILTDSGRLAEEKPRVRQVASDLHQLILLNDNNGGNTENIPPEDLPLQRQKFKAAPKGRREMGANRTRKIKIPRMKGETQTGKCHSVRVFLYLVQILGTDHLRQSKPISRLQKVRSCYGKGQQNRQ